MHSAHHVITRTFDTRFLSYWASCGEHYPPVRTFDRRLLSSMASYDVASTVRQSLLLGAHGGRHGRERAQDEPHGV
jgi:hypothetical protein